MSEPANDPKPSWVVRLFGGLIWRYTPKCHDMTRLYSQSLDAPLPLITRIKMNIHTRYCAWCDRYRRQLGLLSEASRTLPEKLDDSAAPRLSDDARQRLKTALHPPGQE